MALRNYQTGEIMHDAKALTERLASALADAARESDAGTVYASWDGAAWDYVGPLDVSAAKARGEELVIVFDA